MCENGNESSLSNGWSLQGFLVTAKLGIKFLFFFSLKIIILFMHVYRRLLRNGIWCSVITRKKEWFKCPIVTFPEGNYVLLTSHVSCISLPFFLCYILIWKKKKRNNILNLQYTIVNIKFECRKPGLIGAWRGRGGVLF